MEIDRFARTILYGNTLEEKLLSPETGLTEGPQRPAIALPKFPGRPARLARLGKSAFPDLSTLNQDSTRGRILHFFANHELLAMELMALVLLRFPEAPRAFREGIVRTILEEQSHMRLYIDRMRELGVDFGDLPVNSYFWKAISPMRSPIEFVVQMSLTLEQANLDFSAYYRDQVAASGDERTAEILDRVYREEIGHVKHGVNWFNRWRENPQTESDWDAYLRLLPPPMNAERAKGIGFQKQGRREAGLSETFILALELHSGSKGRPPTVFEFLPSCEAEIARGKAGHTPSAPVERLTRDLEGLLAFVARPGDLLITRERPRLEWLRMLSDGGFSLPEFIEGRDALSTRLHGLRLGGFQPWGWCPSAFERFKRFAPALTPASSGNARWLQDLFASETFITSGLTELFSKAWSADRLKTWMLTHPTEERFFGSPSTVAFQAGNEAELEEHAARWLKQGQSVFLKAPWGTSGTQSKRLLKAIELQGPIGGWARDIIRTQGGILVEPYLEKRADLSLQLWILENEIQIQGPRRFLVGSRHEYRGSWLDPKLASLGPEILEFLHSGALNAWKQLATDWGRMLREAGYQGPAGIDGMVYQSTDGSLRLKPVVEVNPRWTMGRIALELETHVRPGIPAFWAFLPIRGNAREDLTRMLEAFPARFEDRSGGRKLVEGIFPTNDPQQARETLTVLAAGAPAVNEILQRIGYSAAEAAERLEER